MRRNAIGMFAVLLAMGVLVAACRAEVQPWQPPQVVKIEGGDRTWVVLSPIYPTSFNVEATGTTATGTTATGTAATGTTASGTTASGTTATGTAAAEVGRTAILVRDGELLGGMGTIPYLTSDGTSLVVREKDDVVTLNGRAVSLNEKAAEWVQKAKPQDLASVRFVEIESNIADDDELLAAVLDKLVKANPRMGLSVKAAAVPAALKRFHPRWLMVNDASALDEAGRKALVAVEPMDTLMLGECKDADLTFLGKMAGVRMLFLSELQTGAAPIPAPRGLRSLIVMGADMTDLSPLANMKDIDELSLVLCGKLIDLSGLARHKGLRTFVLTDKSDRGGVEKSLDLAPLKALKDLRWLGLPSWTTPAQIEEIVRDHPDLVVLELNGCEAIKDLTPLAKLTKLEAVILATSARDFSPLHGLKSLRLVGLSPKAPARDEQPEVPIDPEQVAKLQKALPKAEVVSITPICLGSGWILALAAAVAAGYVVVRRRKETRNSERGTRNAGSSPTPCDCEPDAEAAGDA